MAFKHGSQTLIDIDATGATQIQSAVGEDIALYPHSNIWIKEGTKLIFEGTVPDNFEAKLQATAVTADRDLILPDESGTLATQAYVTSAVSGGSLTDTDALPEGSTNLYYTNARADARIVAAGSVNWNTAYGWGDHGTAGYLTSVPAQSFASLTGKPTTIAGYGITDAFDGAFSSLTGKPTTLAGYGITDGYDNADVDAHLNQSNPTNGYVLSWNGSDYAWVAQSSYTNFNTDFDTRLATKDTGDLAEGSNLYYTDARVQAVSINELSEDTTPELSGDLVTAGNRITHASSGTVSMMDFTKTLFGETNHTVLSSVKSIDLFLDSNGGDTGQAFRIYNNQNPDGTVTENTHIFKVSETGDVSVSNDLNVGGDAIITGDLTVSGTTTTINTNELNIGDNILTLNSDETGTPSQNAGIEVERGTSTNVAVRWNETSDAWEFTNDGTNYTALGTSSTFTGNTDGISEGSTNLYYTDARADARATLRINAATTDNISEGTGNLYYTDARAQAVSINNVVEDTSPQLGGTLDANGNTIDMGTNTITDTKVGQWDTAYGWGNHASAGYITGYTVTQSDVTSHQAALSITQSQISDLDHYTDADVDAHLSGGTGVNYASGAISIGQNVSTSSHVQFHCIGVGTAASTNAGEIRATADITAYYSSDKNLKENIINITNALEKVQKIRGVEFDWTQEYIDARGGEDDYFVRKHDTGVIAQEVEEVLPEVVATRDDGTKAVKYDRMVGLLIEAIKEQQSQIDSLKQTIEELKHK